MRRAGATERRRASAGWDEKLGAYGQRTRTIHTRLKMTRVPGVEAVEQLHPRRAPRARIYPVFAKLCKTCRRTALSGKDSPAVPQIAQEAAA